MLLIGAVTEAHPIHSSNNVSHSTTTKRPVQVTDEVHAYLIQTSTITCFNVNFKRTKQNDDDIKSG